jgi:hypothetical protein
MCTRSADRRRTEQATNGDAKQIFRVPIWRNSVWPALIPYGMDLGCNIARVAREGCDAGVARIDGERANARAEGESHGGME